MTKFFKTKNVLTLVVSVILLMVFLIPSMSVFAVAVEWGGEPIVNGTGPSNNITSGTGPSSSGSAVPIMFNIPNPFGQESFTLFDFVKRLVNLATRIAIPIIILMIIYAGFLFVKAQGAPEKISEAKQTLAYTLLGAGIILGANVIALAIEATVTGLIK